MATLFAQTESGFTAEQSAGSNLDYGLDWSDFLATAPGDVIQSSTWTPEDPTVVCSNAAVAGAITTVWITGGQPGQWYALVNEITTRDGRRDSRICLLYVRPALSTGSALFKSRLVALAKLRRDRLVVAASGAMPEFSVSDDYLWEKLRAAESYVSGLLRVPLAPIRYFPIQPTQAEIDALAGQPWEIDSGYDYDPGMFQGDKWGYIVTRHRPILSVQYMRFCYPTQDQGFFDVPREWLRIDSRAGHIRMIPASAGVLVGSAGFALSTLINRRAVPDMVQISYTAGLQDVHKDFPELVDVIYKKAVVNVLADAFLPQSGSISADGLSQSLSVDMSKYSDAIDEIINGPKGSNGGLMTRIHGIRSMVF